METKFSSSYFKNVNFGFVSSFEQALERIGVSKELSDDFNTIMSQIDFYDSDIFKTYMKELRREYEERS
jgi:hypothetical protein